jgi:hypothetical protein
MVAGPLSWGGWAARNCLGPTYEIKHPAQHFMKMSAGFGKVTALQAHQYHPQS